MAILGSLCIAAVLPLKGLVLWPDEAAAHPELREVIALEFSYCQPSAVVTGWTNGTVACNWAPIDRLLAGIAARGHQAVLRFRYEYPGEKLDGVKGATAVPACVKTRDDYRESFAKNPNGDGPTWYADWSCAALKELTLAFYRAFAARYDRDPRLAFLEVGFGHWSEYHICGTKLKLGKNFPDKDYQSVFLREMDALFRETPWLISIDAAERERSSAVEWTSLGFGLFDDSFMCRRHDLAQGEGYNETCWRAFGTERWRRTPGGGEISYAAKRDQREFLNPKGLYGVTWEQAAAKYHLTFAIANDSLAGRFATPRRFAQASEACGYDLRLKTREAKDGQTRLTLVNVGVAPPYHDLRVELDGHVSSETLKGLSPGQTRTLSFATEAPKPAWLVSKKFLDGTKVELREIGR